MPYSASDEHFVHQLPRTFDHVDDSETSWSDRCYFNLFSPDAELLVTMGYGNYPNTQWARGYGRVALADGRHIDIDVSRRCADDRDLLAAGGMQMRCIDPLQRWELELGPNGSGVEWQLEYESRAPLWELLPITIRKRGRTVVDMTHIKQPGRYRGWVSIDGERIDVDGFHGGRDRTFGLRAQDQVDFWLWFEAGFDDCAVEAWVWEAEDGSVESIDGGITYEDGRLSKRFVSFEHDVSFDGDRRRPTGATVVFTDEDGETIRIAATAEHLDVTAYYAMPHPERVREGELQYHRWDSTVGAALDETEAATISLDQLMRFEMGDQVGHGIFELLVQGRGYARYPNWPAPRRR